MGAKAVMLCVGVVGAIRTSLPTRSRVVRMDGILDPNPPMGRQDARELAEKLNPVIGFYDPLGLSSANFWEKGNDFTCARASTALRRSFVLLPCCSCNLAHATSHPLLSCGGE